MEQQAVEHALPFYQEPEIWLVVALAILVAVAWRPVKTALFGALDSRAEQIKAEIAEAKRLREEAQALLAGYKRKQRDAMHEAEEIVAHARAEADRMRQRAERELEQSLQRRERLAMERIARAEAAAVDEVRDLAVDIAVAAAGQVLNKELAGPDGDRLVAEAITDLPGRLH